MTDNSMTLLERLEAAPEGSRELDAEIALSAGWKHKKAQHGVGRSGLPVWAHQWVSPDGRTKDFVHVSELVDGNLNYAASDDVPHYTTSIDAALLLVPEGWHIELSGEKGADGGGMCLTGNGLRQEIGLAATPALALCIASLRARSTDDG